MDLLSYTKPSKGKARNAGNKKISYFFKKFCLVISMSQKINSSYTLNLHYKQEVSYVDAMGYILTLENNLLFVTGDKEFKNISHVEWVQ